MPADSQPDMIRASFLIFLAESLSETEKRSMSQLLALLPEDNDNISRNNGVHIKRFVDGHGLACPMPLLKTKVALRDVGIGESLYVVATDPNSQADITAFCRQSQQTNPDNQLLLTIQSATNIPPDNDIPAQRFDTIYHFIITKTDSN